MTNLTRGTEHIDIWAKNGQIKIKKPSAIIEYNRIKSGVDKANPLKVQYQFNHRDVKWWKRVFNSFIYAIIVDA